MRYVSENKERFFIENEELPEIHEQELEVENGTLQQSDIDSLFPEWT